MIKIEPINKPNKTPQKDCRYCNSHLYGGDGEIGDPPLYYYYKCELDSQGRECEGQCSQYKKRTLQDAIGGLIIIGLVIYGISRLL